LSWPGSSGDPALWGAVQEQRELCDELAAARDVPGVSRRGCRPGWPGTNHPELAQSVILTRSAAARPRCRRGGDRRLRPHGTTMAVFCRARSGSFRRNCWTRLPAGHAGAGGLPGDPARRAGRGLHGGLCGDGPRPQAVEHAVPGRPALAASGTRSHLYHPGHFTGTAGRRARARATRAPPTRLLGRARPSRAARANSPSRTCLAPPRCGPNAAHAGPPERARPRRPRRPPPAARPGAAADGGGRAAQR
jgi:hypothetical protein